MNKNLIDDDDCEDEVQDSDILFDPPEPPEHPYSNRNNEDIPATLSELQRAENQYEKRIYRNG